METSRKRPAWPWLWSSIVVLGLAWPGMGIAQDQRPVGTVLEDQRINTGIVIGQVVDTASGDPVSAADIWLDGTRWRAITTPDGRYRLTGIAPGQYTLRVRRIGYRLTSRMITVQADQTHTVNFALQSSPTQLDEVVATVTGEQRIREMGHTVGRIRADSLVMEAPISTIGELLTARVPGLLISNTSGTVGGEMKLQLRSHTSHRLSNEPVVIVDGIRYTSHNGDGTTRDIGPPYGSSVEPTSRLNDLNPNDIATIEVVKGPSASTLYGTDAANGVIVITTKAGRRGPARWNAYVRAGYAEIPHIRYPDSYWGWGSRSANCTLRLVGLGNCVQDSVTIIPNPLNDPQLTIFGSKPRWQYGANVSGGTDAISYYLSADLDNAVGPLRMPALMVRQLREEFGGATLPKSLLEPNTVNKISLRANITTRVGETGQVRLSVNYTQNEVSQINLANPYSIGPSQSTPDGEPYGVFYSPLRIFAQNSTESVNRFTGSLNGSWQPLTWLSMRGTLGLDLPVSHRYNLVREGAWEDYEGSVGEDITRALITTGEVGATANFRWDRISSRTSIGSQYVRNYRNTIVVSGVNLRPGGSSIVDASGKDALQHYRESVTIGSYLEQVFGFNDRVFLTGAIRADGASTFGNNYKAAFYPKFGFSWIASDEPFIPELPGLDELRFRYAYGASGQQPTPGMRHIAFSATSSFVDGRDQPSINVARIANPDLRPEQVREHEFGLDLSALSGRVGLDLTWARRRTVDMITTIALPADFGNVWTNIGLVSGRAFEARLRAELYNSDLFSWDAILSHATHTDIIEDLGGTAPTYRSSGSSVEGYPMGARFMRPLLGYADANGDGRIDITEVQMGDTAVYVGRGTPGLTRTLVTTLGFFRQRLRVTTLFEHRGDFTQFDLLRLNHRHLSFAGVDPNSPLEQQAKVAATYAGQPQGQPGTDYTFNEPGDFTRLREVTIAWTLPDSWAQLARLNRASINLSGRNLALWTKYGGPDPESVRLSGPVPTGGRADAIPQSRHWILRVDLGF